MRLISHCQPKPSEVLCLKTRAKPQNIWDSGFLLILSVVRLEMFVLLSLAAFLESSKLVNPPSTSGKHIIFLPQNHRMKMLCLPLHAPLKQRSMFLCCCVVFPHEKHRKKNVVIVNFWFDVITLLANWNICVLSLQGFLFPRIPIFKVLTMSTMWFLYLQHWFYSTLLTSILHN